MLARVLTALALIPVVLAVVFCTSPWPVGVLLLVIAGLGLLEFAKLAQIPNSYFASSVLIPPVMIRIINTSGIELLYGAVGFWVFFWFMVWILRRMGQILRDAVWLTIPLALLFVLHIRTAPTDTLWNVRTWLLMPLVPLWIGDSAAIFAGKAFGKHLMAPTISPKKTWEGGIANFFGCILGAYLVGLWCQIPLGASLGCGAAIGVLGQVGDLYESALKRQAGVKDSGTLLPGHGGILDRIDSILMSAPVVVLILLYIRH